MHEECLICGAPLVYLTQDEEMECALCHRRERSKTRCQKGHYVCNTCHTRGLDQLVAQETGMPVHVAERPLDCVVDGTGKRLEIVMPREYYKANRR